MKCLGGLDRSRRGPADRERRGRRSPRTARSPQSARRQTSGSGEAHDGCVILPGFVNAHSHIEYAVYAGFGDGLPFVPWIGMHIRRKEALDHDDMVAIATVGAHEMPPLGCDDDRRLQLLRRCRDWLRQRPASARSSSSRSSAATRRPSIGSTRTWRGSSRRSRISSASVSRRTRRTPARSRSIGRAQSSGFRRRRISPRAPRSASGSSTGPATGARSPRSSCPSPGETGIRLLASEGLLGPASWQHIASTPTTRRSRSSRPTASGWPTAPARTATSAAAPPRSRSCGRRVCRVSIATDSPASTPSLDLFEEMRTAIVGARARAERPEALSAAEALELATLGGARILGLEDRIGSIVAGKQADLTVLSLAGGPFDPVEDPVIAAVLGGSPDRVAATLVAGEERYRKGTSRWPDSTRAARSARGKMLP